MRKKIMLAVILLMYGTLSLFGQTGFSDDHDDGKIINWDRYGRRAWVEENGRLHPQDAAGEEGFLIKDYATTSDGILEVNIEADPWNGYNGGVVFRWTSESSYYFIGIKPGNEWDSGIWFCVDSMDIGTETKIAGNTLLRNKHRSENRDNREQF